MKRLAGALVLLAIAAAPAYAGRVMVTPEPSSIVLLATGVSLVGAGAWWRSRRR